jgi:hypothetical protein
MAGGSGKNGESVCHEGMNVAVVWDARGIGVFGKSAEAQTEGLMLRVRQLLTTKENHLVPE